MIVSAHQRLLLTAIFCSLKMSGFVLNKQHLTDVLIFLFKCKKSAAEVQRILVEIESWPTISSYRVRFRRFKCGDFQFRNKGHDGQPSQVWRWEIGSFFWIKICVKCKLNSRQTIEEIFTPYQRRNPLLHRMLRYQSKTSTAQRSYSAYGGIRCMVYYELLKPSAAIDVKRYWLQLMHLSGTLREKRQWSTERQHKFILQHCNSRLHVSVTVKNYVERLKNHRTGLFCIPKI